MIQIVSQAFTTLVLPLATILDELIWRLTRKEEPWEETISLPEVSMAEFAHIPHSRFRYEHSQIVVVDNSKPRSLT